MSDKLTKESILKCREAIQKYRININEEIARGGELKFIIKDEWKEELENLVKNSGLFKR